MKHDPVSAAAPASADAGAPDPGAGNAERIADRTADTSATLIGEILNIMEQGILFWSAEGVCELHNSRIFRVLEITAKDLGIGTRRTDFRDRAVARGEMTAETRRASEAQIEAHLPYSFDRHLPSGRVVFTNGRPTRGGGYVVTFTDVTEARLAAKELARAKAEAEEAQGRAVDLLAQERDRQTEARHLSQLDEWLQSCKSLQELYAVITHFMARLLPRSQGELYIYQQGRAALGGICSWGGAELHPTIEADACWALRRGRTYEFHAGNLCFPCEHVEAPEGGGAPEEYVCVPIIAHGDTVGMLHIRFDHASDDGARIDRSGAFAIRCAEHISMAIANVKLRDELHERSIRDALTGLYNRRFFMDAIRRELAQAGRSGAPLALVAMDADNFKAFNDGHGHEAGDAVLRAIADRIAAAAGPGGIACRMGGEEFALLLPGLDAASAVTVAEDLREAVGNLQLRHLDRSLPRVTVSSGIAVAPRDGADPQALMRLADEALYRAKASGRDCVRIAGA
ncbi:sensor domain-containing diguanylate cyclase [Wenxinia marina]|uniref:diguanylate cyclase n=1 Tax=Wenxinia marina DSM 24838 TaxID=1123501 RepID=A0A0D0Q682_9RHOB|nr:sensor domain-containing diguanylate cyclase [Wenxinia marina]KIQ69979.1 diguanylate cyclase (GGDEF) domain protein [Wenxinia marina DSM 24838]GGL62645.1 hypothetical protein GCM10011392_16540 [Wenxinia marina]